jgi:hypothetical protein
VGLDRGQEVVAKACAAKAKLSRRRGLRGRTNRRASTPGTLPGWESDGEPRRDQHPGRLGGSHPPRDGRTEGNVWCLADDARTGITSYGNVDEATVEACVGGWDAHPEAAGPD